MASSPLLVGRGKSRKYGTALSQSLSLEDPSRVSLLSRCFFSFATPLMAAGNDRVLTVDDLWPLTGENATERAYAAFKSHFDVKKGSLVRAIVATYAKPFVLCGIVSLFSVGASVLAPAVLRHVIEAFAAPQIDVPDLLRWLGVFFVYKIADAFVSVHTRYYVELTALRMTSSIKALLFEKAMRRSQQSKQDANAVDMANLVTSDVNNVLWASYTVNNLWILPIQIVVVGYMLYDVLGVAAFAGLGVIGLTMLVGFVITKLSGDAYTHIMERKDTRIKAIKELFSAIQIVKFNAWETKVDAKIHRLRAHEMKALTRFLYMLALSNCVLWASPLIVSIVSFAVYSIVMRQVLTAAKVFTAIALFNALRLPLQALPQVVSQCLQAKIAIDRMSAFLKLDEVDFSRVIRDGSTYPADVAIDVQNGSFGWTKDLALLKNVNISVKKGDLVVIHGSVGAGKSSLCSALLGEMDKLSGSVFVRGRVAYYSQQTWIQNMTIRENILFGKAYDEKTYQRVLDACGLVSDIAGFPAGDSTEIGQKGVNLSGGQKARLCLARACYSDADVLILDSPLAAVDAVVQSEIFNKCLCSLLESKTVVLVTHAPDIIASEAANYKLEVVDGVVSGERHEPVKRRSEYANLLASKEAVEPGAGESKESSSDKFGTVDGSLVDDEAGAEGRVSTEVFLKYFEAIGGLHVCFAIVLLQILWQGLQIASDFWLSHWTGQKVLLVAEEDDETEWYMMVYAALGLGSAAMVLIRSIAIAVVGISASKNLFRAMTRSLLHAPLRFFDANPIGRIVNRYGDDVSSVDFMIPYAFTAFLAIFFAAACQLMTAIFTVKLLGLFVLPLVYIYVSIGNFYLAPSRQITRMWKISGSPVLSHVTASEEGVATLRAFGADYAERAVAETFRRTDISNRAWFAIVMANFWFQVRIQLLGCGVIIVIVSALVYLHAYLTPGIVGLAFTYALSVEGGLALLVQMWSWLEVCMVSAERVLEYSSIEPEGKFLQIEPAPQWPQQGAITFDNVVFSYKPGAPAVLKGLSFSIKNNEKIGIVGRTGAGKSSLTLALFRINELVSGSVSIDGVDISTMPLQALRSRLSIIPQAPVLFKGPLRAYMDPFEDYSDDEIWEAFEKVEMKEQIELLEGQLAYELSENGENFSVGERQMLCMARAMLTKSRIVVMDEATASIDHATEKKLQHMINRDFQQATVLTIAHRLATVLDSDRIMVLSDGRVMEFDTPRNLVKNVDGMFYELAKEGGVLEKILAKQ